ncbi:MAG: DUF1957 domain-containing protein [Bradymonadales bacterium]|nr:DUF1957 domain-containing protein [Bradymonadales bacterium]
MTLDRGALCLVLHAHLPLVRHPENPHHLEEHWYFEAMADCYLPILSMLDRLNRDQIPGRLTLSLSPTLLSMLDDELLRDRFEEYLERRIALARSEFERTRDLPTFHRLAGWYLGLFEDTLEEFQKTYQRDVASALATHHQNGRLELITCAGTHAVLPLLHQETTRRAHIDLAVEQFHARFGFYPTGLWLPECGYQPGLERLLEQRDIRYTILECHALPANSTGGHNHRFCPAASDNGLAFFTRDQAASAQVWSATTGYPGDPDYREFYRDIGFDLEAIHLGSFLAPDGIRTQTGLKYYRITQAGEPKLPYEPDLAQQKVAEHAAHFIASRMEQLQSAPQTLPCRPLVLAAFDAELFGHWWFEGPAFLEQLFRQVAASPLDLVTPGDYLEAQSALPVASPGTSSWGYNGFFEAWLNPDRNAWLYRYLHHAEDRLWASFHRVAVSTSQEKNEALAQAIRELLLAQGSDWSFILNTGTAVEYAVSRIQDHLETVHRLLDMVENGEIDRSFVHARQERWGIFSGLDLVGLWSKAS